ncbi:unnamed protein product [Amaranthus hypochondriacus]
MLYLLCAMEPDTSSDISSIQKEISLVKEEIQCLLFEIRKFEPLPEAIMTIEEANLSEQTLQETLAKVQQRNVELTAETHNQDALAQSSNSLIQRENLSPTPLEEVLQLSQNQPTQNFENNGIQVPFLPSQELLLAHPQHSGTSFSSLLTAADVLENFSSVEEADLSQSHEQNNNTFSFQQNQLNPFHDELLDTRSYVNDILRVDQSWEKDEIDTYGNTNGYNVSNSNMISSNFELPSSPANFQVLQNQTQFPMQAPYNQIPKMQLESNSNTSVFSNSLWSNQMNLRQNQTTFGQRNRYQDMLSSVPELNNMYSDSGLPASILSTPPTLQINQQSLEAQNNTGSNLFLNTQGSLANNSRPISLEWKGSSSSSSLPQKRKLQWRDDKPLSLSNYQNGNMAPTNLPLAPRSRTLINTVYNTAYQANGLHIDPHFRFFQEMLKRDYNKRQEVARRSFQD